MRVTANQQQELRLALRRRFGTGARLWVFGSRTVDAARGGDFDLLVQSDDEDAEHLLDAKLAFLSDLHATPAFEGERVDVVLHSPKLDPLPRPIQRIAMAEGVEIA